MRASSARSGGTETAENPAGFGAAGGADLGHDVGAVLGHLDQGGPPVGRVGMAPDQVAGLKRVHDLGGVRGAICR